LTLRYRDLYSNPVRVLLAKVEICIRKNEFYEFFLIHYLINSFQMSNFQFSDCKKAVNQALFRPTADRKAAAIKALQEALELVTNLEEVKDKPKASKTKKRRRKTTKRTPSQKVADHMDKASMKTNEVGPVKPSKKAKTASVKEAKASLKEMDAKNKAKKQSKIEAKKVAMGVSETDRVASLEAKIEALTQCLAMHMETTSLPSAIEDSNNVPF
tara:strand:- start:1503 stop:2144 length:642 start_codon:yes stop_codon:yes gene_type:complete